MGEAAMMGEAEGWTAEAAEDVKVRSFGVEGQRERGQRGLAIEAGASHAGAGQEMGDGFQAVKKDSMGMQGEMPRSGRELPDRRPSRGPNQGREQQ